MTGAELLLIGLRLRPGLDEEFAGELSLIVPTATGSLDDLVPLAEQLIKEGNSHLRPWIACARQLENAAIANENAVRDFMLETYEKARSLGWTPDRDLMDWVRDHAGLEVHGIPAGVLAATTTPGPSGEDWA